MLRFLSRRKGRNASSGIHQSGDIQTNNTSSHIKSQRILPNKNLIQCRVILLDGADLSVDLTVSRTIFSTDPKKEKRKKYKKI